MRTIKFRVWDTSEMRMHYDVLNNARKLKRILELEEENNEFARMLTGVYSDKKVMQFTGLHDKNGKEIYEGDILKTEHGATGVMRWHEPTAQFNYDCREPMWAHPIYSMSGEKEIIGNIYENQELLSSSKQV